MSDPFTHHKTVSDLLGKHKGSEFEEKYPGLLGALEEVDEEEVDREEFTRKALNSVKDTPEFLSIFDRFDDDLQDVLRRFMGGEMADSCTKRGFRAPRTYAIKQQFQELRADVEDLAAEAIALVGGHDEDTDLKIYENKPFANWGQTVQNTPSYTFVPTTVKALQKAIKRAVKEKKRVRAAGFRHTWSNMYPQDKEFLVSLIDLSIATGTSRTVHQDAIDGPATEFNRIQLDTKDIPNTDGKKRLARVGAGVSNEAFRIWAIGSGWTLPLNVIMVEITLGGSNAPICHGAGITHKTLSDLVRKIEYVDAKGEQRIVDDPEMIKAAAGAFGLLGIVTHLTFELDKMTYAELTPLKQDIRLAIPPPAGYKVPSPINWDLTEEERKNAELEFIKKANSYYSEWFWFPYQGKVWVNCWDNTEDATGSAEYPSTAEVLIQWGASLVAASLNSGYLFKKLSGRIQGLINGTAAMVMMPSGEQIKTPLIDGLHFQRGIQNFPVRDAEVEIPIPALATDPTKPDWSMVQRAWWDAITIAYDDMKKTGAMRIVLEMRITGPSDIIMAPQSKNTFGTASIEVITNLAAAQDGSWKPFVQKLLDAWTAYEANGVKLNVRPHWAKEWDGWQVGGVDWKKHLKEVSYKDEIKQFKAALTTIGKGKGDKPDWTLDDIKERFSNELFDYLYFNEV